MTNLNDAVIAALRASTPAPSKATKAPMPIIEFRNGRSGTELKNRFPSVAEDGTILVRGFTEAHVVQAEGLVPFIDLADIDKTTSKSLKELMASGVLNWIEEKVLFPNGRVARPTSNGKLTFGAAKAAPAKATPLFKSSAPVSDLDQPMMAAAFTVAKAKKAARPVDLAAEVASLKAVVEGLVSALGGR